MARVMARRSMSCPHKIRTRRSPVPGSRRRKEATMSFHTSTGLTVQDTLARDASRSRVRMIVYWLVLWIITLPLVHVHIQADRQQGLPHNVLAGDLPGEFVSSPDSTTEATRPSGIPAPPHLASGLSYPELAFTAPVPSKHQWLFHLTAILAREEPAEPPVITTALIFSPLVSENARRSDPFSPRAPPITQLT